MRDSIYEESYRKGWPDKAVWQKLVQAITHRDAEEIEDLVDTQDTQAVDTDIFMCKSVDTDLLVAYQPKGVFTYGDNQHRDELKFLHKLSALRDESLEDLPNSLGTKAHRMVSWFLQGQEVPRYTPGVNYMTTEVAFNTVQQGGQPTELQRVSGSTKILTGRDAAAYVHKDDPLIPFLLAAKTMLGLGVRFRVEAGMVHGKLKRFASCGLPHIYGTLGEGIKRLCPVSFREKWYNLIPRPEEASPDIVGELLPQTYAEGSPYHPARNSMHFLAAAVLAELLAEIFDRYHVLPSGRTVEAELYLMRDNIGVWREWAGVHYPSDSLPYVDRAKALAHRIIRERYG